jgi:uroporphyrinogen decarboxylase
MPSPDFQEFLKMLRREPTDRPVLYELYINNEIYSEASGETFYDEMPMLAQAALIAKAFANLGYDYANPWRLSDFRFPAKDRHAAASVSMNESAEITDRASFEAYPWPDPSKAMFLDDADLQAVLPEGMKFLTFGPGGMLEATMRLVGFDNLCMMLVDDPDLVREIFDHVGRRLLAFYTILGQYDSIGALVVTDDWGFKTQTMLSPAHLREYVFPWHEKIVAAIHAAGKPAILHSCGNPVEVIDDVIDRIGYDARHSYEDAIVPVEDAYDRWGERIAILGGIDVDFLSRSTPEQIRARCHAMLEKTMNQGGYALGTGNSVPEYIPRENYEAMLSVAREF